MSWFSEVLLKRTWQGFKQHDTQYSYTAQQRFGKQVRHGNNFLASVFPLISVSLQQPFLSNSAREHTYPRSSTISDLPWIELRQESGSGSSSVSFATAAAIAAGSASGPARPGMYLALVQIIFLRSSSCDCR
uniref:Uncharacterized protein n=1 Tax=Anopheles culicifacies TaxID=139723 RepID=A0A182MLG0_9DIPT